MSNKDDMSEWGEAMQEQADTPVDADISNEISDVADSTDTTENPWGNALAEQSESEESKNGDIDAADFEQLQKSRGDSADKVDLDVLLDIPVTLQLEIGRAKVSIRNLLSYTQGSVIEMSRLAGEPLDLLVNGTLIAHGEVVVINDKFGVRLTDVVSPQERIKQLK